MVRERWKGRGKKKKKRVEEGFLSKFPKKKNILIAQTKYKAGRMGLGMGMQASLAGLN